MFSLSFFPVLRNCTNRCLFSRTQENLCARHTFLFSFCEKKRNINHKLTSPQYSLMKAFLRTESLTNIPQPAISDGANSRFYGYYVKKIIVLKIALIFATNAERTPMSTIFQKRYFTTVHYSSRLFVTFERHE